MSNPQPQNQQNDLALLWQMSGSQIVSVGATEHGDLTLSLVKGGKRIELMFSGDEDGLTITEIIEEPNRG